MKSHLKQTISGVAIACVFPLLLSGCLIEIDAKHRVKCTDNANCASNEICSEQGFCQVVSVKPRTCESDFDCASHQICNSQDLCQDTVLCHSDNECGPTEVCNLEDYCLSPLATPGTPTLAVCLGLCEAHTHVTECSLDSDCATNEYCHLEKVVPAAAPSELPVMAPTGECRQKPLNECFGHSHCEEDQYCAPAWELDHADPADEEGHGVGMPAGICTDLAFDGCVSDKDCGLDATCVIANPWGPGNPGTCVSQSIDCWSHVECGDGFYCAPYGSTQGNKSAAGGEPAMEAPMGICTQLNPGECLTDSDCSASGICEHPNPDMGPGTCAVIITHCSSDSECDWNQECEFSADGDFHENKPLSGICVEKELTHCNGDWDCADGEYCEFDDLGWSQFGCGEHENSEMPMVNQGICVREDIGFE